LLVRSKNLLSNRPRFQLHLTNAHNIIENFFIAQTQSNWRDGGIYFGFNISQAFDFKRDKNKLKALFRYKQPGLSI